jgi:hypothetical protein
MIYQNLQIAKIIKRVKLILFDKNPVKLTRKHQKISKKAQIIKLVFLIIDY